MGSHVKHCEEHLLQTVNMSVACQAPILYQKPAVRCIWRNLQETQDYILKSLSHEEKHF